MAQPLLLDFFQELPHRPTDQASSEWSHKFRRKVHRFEKNITGRYNEGTLERLLTSRESEVRQAAAFALGLVGTMKVNHALAIRLHDEDPAVSQLAGDALWSIWFRADTVENSQELQRLVRLEVDNVGAETVLEGLDALIARAPAFAEAYNQRAVVHFRNGNFSKSILDCEKVLRLNPYHFGAASGLAQCFMKQRKFRAALRSFRRANRIHPSLEGVRQSIESLEKILGEEGKR